VTEPIHQASNKKNEQGRKALPHCEALTATENFGHGRKFVSERWSAYFGVEVRRNGVGSRNHCRKGSGRLQEVVASVVSKAFFFADDVGCQTWLHDVVDVVSLFVNGNTGRVWRGCVSRQ